MFSRTFICFTDIVRGDVAQSHAHKVNAGHVTLSHSHIGSRSHAVSHCHTRSSHTSNEHNAHQSEVSLVCMVSCVHAPRAYALLCARLEHRRALALRGRGHSVVTSQRLESCDDDWNLGEVGTLQQSELAANIRQRLLAPLDLAGGLLRVLLPATCKQLSIAHRI